jgi:hypothetical protein
MSEPKYITGQLGETQAVEGWFSVKGDKVEVYSFEQTVRGETRSPGGLLKSVTLEEGEDPRMVALKVLRDRAPSRNRNTGPLQYPDLGWF